MATSDSQEIIFFDLPTKPPQRGWSLNPWKVRFVLNFKNIPYKTEWIEYPDLKPRFENTNMVPEPTSPPYTSPAVLLPDGTYMLDSWKIAPVLESMYPSPPLHLDSPVLPKVRDIMVRMWTALWPVFGPIVPRRLLSERSAEYFERTRAEVGGMPLDQLEREQGGEQAWDKATGPLQEMTALLASDASGPFFLGKTPSFADFVWAGALIFARNLGEEDFLGELLKRTGDAKVHLDLLEAVKPWSERDDH